MRVIGVGMSGNVKQCGFHSHTHWEICMNIAGETENYSDYVSTSLTEGVIFVCAPGVVHKKIATTNFFKDVFVHLANVDGIFPNDFKCGYFNDTDGSVLDLLKTMHKIINSDLTEKSIIIHSLGEALSYIIQDKIQQNNKLSSCVEKLKSSIIENFSNPEFKATDADEFAFYNKDYMRQIFKKETGQSPLEYLTELRLNNAKKLLLAERTPEFKINEIAILCGFYDVGYFTRTFKKKFDMTPSEFKAIATKPQIEDQDCDCCGNEYSDDWTYVHLT